MTAPLSCDDERRRAAVLARGLAGLAGVEAAADGRSLTVAFFGTLPDGLDRHSFRIEGGRRVTGIRIVSVSRAEPEDGEDRTPGSGWPSTGAATARPTGCMPTATASTRGTPPGSSASGRPRRAGWTAPRGPPTARRSRARHRPSTTSPRTTRASAGCSWSGSP